VNWCDWAFLLVGLRIPLPKEREKPKQDSVWAGLAAVALLVMVLVGALRVCGVLANRRALLDSGLNDARLNYLVVYGVLQVVISLAGLLGMRFKPPLGFALPMAAVILNIVGYWAERLLLWAPDQRGGNIVFMIIWHGLWVGLMVAFTIKPTLKETDGPRN
jgi:hypothetical protein